MKNNIIKKMALLICIATLGITTPGMTTLAATQGITITCKPRFGAGYYYHGVAGQQLEIIVIGNQEDKYGRVSIVTDSCIRNGNFTSVSESVCPSDDENEFYMVYAMAFVNGVFQCDKSLAR